MRPAPYKADICFTASTIRFEFRNINLISFHTYDANWPLLQISPGV